MIKLDNVCPQYITDEKGKNRETGDRTREKESGRKDWQV